MTETTDLTNRPGNDSQGPFIEPLPQPLDNALAAVKAQAEAVHIQVATDMAGQRDFSERWLVVTDRQLLFLRPPGGDPSEQIPIHSVRSARIETLVGGGRLEVERKQGKPAYLYYSNTLTPKFAEVAEGINQLVEGQTLRLPTIVERTRCQQCRRRLPEKDGVCPACVDKLATFKRLLAYMAPYKYQAVLALLLTAVTSLLPLIPPKINQYILDDVLPVKAAGPQDTTDQLAWAVGILLLVNILILAGSISRRWLNAWVGLRAAQGLRTQLYQALLHLPLGHYHKRKAGTLISRMTKDAELVEDYLVFDVPYLLSNSLMVLGILAILFTTNWTLTLYVLLPIPPIILGSSLIWKRMGVYWRRWSTRWSRLQAQLNESIKGIRVVKAFAQEDREGDRFDQHNNELRTAAVRAERSWLVFFLVTNFIMGWGVFLVWYFGGQQVVHGQLQLGQLMAFISYIWMLYQPLQWFGDFYSFMIRAFAGAERTFEVIDARSEPFADPRAIAVPRIRGRVEFKKASFGYDPGKPVLKGLDLCVEPGEMIGLVGRSGAGKSTLVTLITGLLQNAVSMH
ncbi:MAG: ATP-binding cassette domain-containing protein [Candidatus Latescibacteria bacterium]|nr:ATP-binding cassette domain-containing protein [Candidatus Latescibacterota bacterium]